MAQAVCPVTTQNWREVGADSACAGGISNTSGYTVFPSIGITPGGTPYVAWADDSGGDDAEIYVRRWKGGSWEEVGTGSASGGGISNNGGNSEKPSMAVAPDGIPYVAWYDSSGNNVEIYVRRWNSSSWEEVGAGSASGGGISDDSGYSEFPSVAIAPENTYTPYYIPYVAWHDEKGGDYQIYVRRWEAEVYLPIILKSY